MNTDERKEVVQLDKKRTLVDINKTAVNFQAEIIVVGKEFYCLICSQTDLDNSNEFAYKKYAGNFRQTIKVDDNVFQNYYLMMKADEPQAVQVMIRLNPLPKKQPSPQQIPQQSPQQIPQQIPQGGVQQQFPQQQVQPQPQIPQEIPPQQPEYLDQNSFSKSGIWKKVFWAAIILLAIYLVYTFVICKKKPQTETPSTTNPPQASTAPQVPVIQSQPQPEISSYSDRVKDKNYSFRDSDRNRHEGYSRSNFTSGSYGGDDRPSKSSFLPVESRRGNRISEEPSSSFSENIRKYKFVY